MIFLSYAKNNVGHCYCMYKFITGYVTEATKIMWLYPMHYGKPEISNKVVVYTHVALLLEVEEAREGVVLNASEPKTESNDKENEWNTLCVRLDRAVKPT